MLEVLPPFFDHPSFIKAFAKQGTSFCENSIPDHVLFSFHGLPERHLIRGDEENHGCLQKNDCCLSVVEGNRYCYRAHCFKTAALIASELKLEAERWSVSFQSRLGRAEWIKPYTETRIRELARNGVRRLVVFCPSFVADCLETLEEIQIQGKESFEKSGGDKFEFIPCLNDSDDHIKLLEHLIKKNLN